MRVNQHADHAKGFVIFDEAHAAHISRKIVDDIRIAHRSFADLFFLEIEPLIFHRRKKLKPFIDWLYIHGPNICALTNKVRYQMAADESTGATDYRFSRRHVIRK